MNDKIKSLIEIPEGTICIVKDIIAGKGLKRRLMELGITKGVRVKLIYKSGGHHILEVRGERLALSKGIASKIFVEMV